MSITPMREPGSTALLTYAEGDFIEVEHPANGTTDHRGYNEAGDWTWRFDETLQIEHYRTGVHDSPRIGRAVCLIDHLGGTSYEVNGRAYVQSTSGTVLRGGAAMAVNRVSAGRLTVTLTEAMPTATLLIADYSTSRYVSGSGQSLVRVGLLSIAAATQFDVIRYAGPDPDNMTATDGRFAFMVHT